MSATKLIVERWMVEHWTLIVNIGNFAFQCQAYVILAGDYIIMEWLNKMA